MIGSSKADSLPWKHRRLLAWVAQNFNKLPGSSLALFCWPCQVEHQPFGSRWPHEGNHSTIAAHGRGADQFKNNFLKKKFSSLFILQGCLFERGEVLRYDSSRSSLDLH